MTQEELIKRLNSIAQLDIDASRAYEQAIKAIEDPEIRAQLTLYRQDHDRHVADLSQAVRMLGGTPPSKSPDLKGFLIQGMTGIQSSMGTPGALKAMQTNEKLTNKTYADAAKLDLSPEIKTIIDRGYLDEKTHIAYINKALETHAWEHQEAHAGR